MENQKLQIIVFQYFKELIEDLLHLNLNQKNMIHQLIGNI
jgi:hypothetical protein